MAQTAGVSDLLLKWRELRARGEQPDLRQLCRDHPELASEIERQVQIIQRWEALLEVPSDSFDATLAQHPDDTARSFTPTVGHAIAGYELLEVLGEGGMGVVYKARQTSLNRLVALKTLGHSRPGSKQLARFQVEAAAIAKLQHPHIVQVFDLGESAGLPFFTMELVVGGNLAQRLAIARPSPRQAAELISTLANAIQAVHERGIIHRDLKPANVLLAALQPTREGQGSSDPWQESLPKISDFGLAKQLNDSSSPTQTGEILGTPNYMAPEQADGRVDEIGPATDVYALGAILYELLTGKAPFSGPTGLGTLQRVLTEEPARPALLVRGIPRDLEAICLKCLEKRPVRRYGSAAALAEDLSAFLAGHRVAARHTNWAECGLKWARRHPVRALLACAVFVVAGVAVSLVGGRLRQEWGIRRTAVAAAPLAREILSRNCWECHGADPSDLKRNLSILDRAMLIDPGRRIVVPYAPERSRLVQRIEDGSMPPEEEEQWLPRVSPRELEILRTWIAGGAPPFPDEDPARPTPPVVPHSDFAAEAKRIFVKHCFECHRSSVAKGGIKILDHDLLVTKREMIVPGNAEASPLFRHLSDDAEPVMPPEPRERLSTEELQTIRIWIEEGAAPFPRTRG